MEDETGPVLKTGSKLKTYEISTGIDINLDLVLDCDPSGDLGGLD